MRYTAKLNKHQRLQDRKVKMAESMKGDGVFLYENNTRGDLQLPKPPLKGGVKIGNMTIIPVGGRFEGDSYFHGLIKTNELRLIEIIVPPNSQKGNQPMNEQKLILDQPDRVTSQGTVEQVVKPQETLIKEHNPSKKAPETLINEDPLSGVEIILD